VFDPGTYADPVVIGPKVVYVAASVGDASRLFLEIYDTSTGQWSSTPAPDEVLHALTPIAIGSKVLYAGGITFGGQAQAAINYDQVAIYDTDTGQWTSSTLSAGREPHVAIVGHKAILAGGAVGNQGQTNSSDAVDIYDADTGQWSSTRLSSPRQGMAIAVFNGKAIFAGGRSITFLANRDDPSVDIYDAATGHWSTDQLPFDPFGPPLAIVDNKAIFLADDYLHGGLSDTAAIYDASTGQWSSTKLSQPRDLSAVAVVAGKVILAGGITVAYPDSTGTAVDIYDPAAGQWSTGKLSSARAPIAAVIGNLAFFAGNSYGKPTAAVDVYNAATGKWSTTRLAKPRMRPLIATVANQALLIDANTGKMFVDIYALPAPKQHKARARHVFSRTAIRSD
jgi:hypothetical protein